MSFFREYIDPMREQPDFRGTYSAVCTAVCSYNSSILLRVRRIEHVVDDVFVVLSPPVVIDTRLFWIIRYPGDPG